MRNSPALLVRICFDYRSQRCLNERIRCLAITAMTRLPIDLRDAAFWMAPDALQVPPPPRKTMMSFVWLHLGDDNATMGSARHLAAPSMCGVSADLSPRWPMYDTNRNIFNVSQPSSMFKVADEVDATHSALARLFAHATRGIECASPAAAAARAFTSYPPPSHL